QVKKGQLLAVIDAPLLAIAEKEAAVSLRLGKWRLLEAQAKVATLKSEVEVAKSALAQRKAEADGAKALLTFEQKRLDALEKLRNVIKSGVEQNTIEEKKKAVETAKAQLAAATAAIDNAKATLDVKQSKVTEGEAALVTAKAEVELLELSLERARHAVAQT